MSGTPRLILVVPKPEIVERFVSTISDEESAPGRPISLRMRRQLWRSYHVELRCESVQQCFSRHKITLDKALGCAAAIVMIVSLILYVSSKNESYRVSALSAAAYCVCRIIGGCILDDPMVNGIIYECCHRKVPIEVEDV